MAIDPLRVLGALRRRARVIALVAIASGVAGAVIAKTLVKREYEAGVVLLWEQAVGRDEVAHELQTVLDSVKIPKNLEKVRERLGVPTAIELLGQRVSTVSSNESKVVTIKARADDPELAARFTNTVVEVFFENRVENERDRLSEQISKQTAAVSAARDAIAKARKAYDDFRNQHGIADLPVETQAAIELAARIRTEGELARVEIEAEEARLEALRKAAAKESPTAVLSESEVLPDAQKLAQARTELVALKAQLSPDHPRVQALEAQVASLEQRVAESPPPTTAGRIVGRNPQWDTAREGLTHAAAQRDAALKKKATYAELTTAAQTMIAKLSQIEGEASALLSALHLAEQQLAERQERLARLEDAARSPNVGFRVLSPARVPTLPVKSRRALVAIMAPILGLLAAAMAVLARAVWGLRAHVGTELAFWGRGPVVATSTWPRDPEALDDLVADLGDAWRGSSGTTLVAGFGEAEARHVGPLLERLARVPAAPGPSPGPQLRALEIDQALPALRRAARRAARVLVLVEAGKRSGPDLVGLATRLGRSDGIGFVLLGIAPELVALPDHIGDTRGFWRAGADAADAPALSPSEPPRAAPQAAPPAGA
ncbi:GumC family protein [Sorangium sp. So ce131]|uniref:GumC family protein n=1 Tax=Sorangium sp. So ce131 TaxID=3133282 RepID=UPI003F6226E9